MLLCGIECLFVFTPFPIANCKVVPRVSDIFFLTQLLIEFSALLVMGDRLLILLPILITYANIPKNVSFRFPVAQLSGNSQCFLEAI